MYFLIKRTAESSAILNNVKNAPHRLTMLHDELKDQNVTLIKLLDEVNGEGIYCIEEKVNTYKVFKRTIVPNGYLLYGYFTDELLYYYDLVNYKIHEKIDITHELLEVYDVDEDLKYIEDFPALPPKLTRQAAFTIEQIANKNTPVSKCVVRD